MKLFRFYLPEYDNSGKPLINEHEGFKNHLLRAAGGYTSLGMAHGAWLDEKGSLRMDSLRIYEVAYSIANDDRDAQGNYEATIAVAMGLFSDQHAIFSAEIGTGKITERNNT